MTENHRTLDGNAAAGPLMELFTLDLTAARSTCTHCGNSSPLASHDLYTDSPAIVLRCPTCAGVVLRYASTGGRIRLDFSGSRLLVLPLDT
jgi:ribosomal protein S27AE